MKLAVIHNLPIDYYPPAVNMVNTLSEEARVSVITTRREIGHKILDNPKVKIYYGFKEVRNGASVLNLIRQVWFVLFALAKLISIKPDLILYFESISVAPAYLYKRLFNHEVTLCVHYHEYQSKQEYKRPGMRIWEIYRTLEEKWVLRQCKWISHTNSYRLGFFKKDYPFLKDNQCFVLPNYPPEYWACNTCNRKVRKPIKCVYIGSLSLTDLYLEEVVSWINRLDGKVTIDFYSFNYHKEVVDYLENICPRWVTFHKNGIDYFDIPSLLAKYDVGLLLYKARTLNYKYNETNKFYEYLICGLDVWYPSSMYLVNEIAQTQFPDCCHAFNPQKHIWPKIDSQKFPNKKSVSWLGCERVYRQMWNQISRV